jgi:hypothetical protein
MLNIGRALPGIKTTLLHDSDIFAHRSGFFTGHAAGSGLSFAVAATASSVTAGGATLRR